MDSRQKNRCKSSGKSQLNIVSPRCWSKAEDHLLPTRLMMLAGYHWPLPCTVCRSLRYENWKNERTSQGRRGEDHQDNLAFDHPCVSSLPKNILYLVAHIAVWLTVEEHKFFTQKLDKHVVILKIITHYLCMVSYKHLNLFTFSSNSCSTMWQIRLMTITGTTTLCETVRHVHYSFVIQALY